MVEGLPNAVLECMAALSAGWLKLLRDPGLSCKMTQSGHEFTIRNFGLGRPVREASALDGELLQRSGGNH